MHTRTLLAAAVIVLAVLAEVHAAVEITKQPPNPALLARNN
jgi:hypothetical protein